MKRNQQTKTVKGRKAGLRIEYQGIVASVYGHAKRLGLSCGTCGHRIERLGTSPEVLDEVFAPRPVKQIITYRGFTGTIPAVAKHFGLAVGAVRKRMKVYPLVPENYDRIFLDGARFFEYQGVRDSLYGHARRFGLTKYTVAKRIREYGFSKDTLPLILEPRKPTPVYEYGGVTDTLKGHCRRLGLRWKTVCARRNVIGESAATLPQLLAQPVTVNETFVYQGIRDTVRGHARRLGLNDWVVRGRIRRLGTTPEALSLVFSPRRLKSTFTKLTCNGVTDTIRGWALRLGMTTGAVYSRLKCLPPEEALTRPRSNRAPHRYRQGTRLLTCDGITDSILHWAVRLDISPSGIESRLKRGMSDHDALYPPPRKSCPRRPPGENVRRSLAALGIIK